MLLTVLSMGKSFEFSGIKWYAKIFFGAVFSVSVFQRVRGLDSVELSGTQKIFQGDLLI